MITGVHFNYLKNSMCEQEERQNNEEQPTVGGWGSQLRFGCANMEKPLG